MKLSHLLCFLSRIIGIPSQQSGHVFSVKKMTSGCRINYRNKECQERTECLRWCSLFTATPHWPLTRPSHPAAGQLRRSSPHLATDLHLLFYKYVYGFPDYQNIKTKIKDLLYLCQKCSVIQTGFRQQHFTGKLWLNARHPKYFSFGFFYSD